jgi:hypothetical protein
MQCTWMAVATAGTAPSTRSSHCRCCCCSAAFPAAPALLAAGQTATSGAQAALAGMVASSPAHKGGISGQRQP